MYINQSLWGQVQGIDILSGCKGKAVCCQAIYYFFFGLANSTSADPGKQFDLVAHHLQSIRRLPGFEASRFVIYVERNLGFEAGESGLSLSLLSVSI